MNKKIYVVDDNEGIREALHELLELLGYDSFLFQDGKDAMDSISSKVPDLIISDLIMAQMDGKQLTEALKSNKDFNRIPIILLTAYPLEEAGFKDARFHPDLIMQKPYELDELKKEVDRLLRAS
ncbi:MAG: hypothetical protein CMB80_26120 [Flammeovirgaceae bacterium]|nr:hypothetical protein [Flammeovirgaceae bacterium]HCX25155.1 hypothetical protein [Cytophagales bacterium]|tara:strand:+ start:105 stop:476 length:372 start_codon:yes stop_codon:yes gene_type:complete